MKISKIRYASLEEFKQMERFDVKSMPKKAKWYWQLLAWFLSLPQTFLYGVKIKKIRMKQLKGGYLLLCNHNSFFDFKVLTRAIFPRKANYIVSVDGFINREQMMRNVGCVAKRKFVPDISLVKQIKYSIEENKYICALYPEARYSLIGTTAILPESLGKMIKKYKYPVATLIANGHHLHQPIWNLHKRKVKFESTMTYLLTPEEIKKLSVKEIDKKIKEAFYYNDYQYQLDNNIKIKEKNRADNLHKVLYKCPHCQKENTMIGKGTKLTCKSCNTTYYLDELNLLNNIDGETKFSFIPDWFEWQRQSVKKEIMKDEYQIKTEVYIDALPNSTGFYRLGVGELIHDKRGFHLKAKIDGKIFSVEKPALSKYGVHIEFNYFGKGDCVIMSTENDTYHLYPVKQDVPVTKYHFAVEELYKYVKGKKG
ncbi:MAG: hypothetical protein K9L64_06200 [Candidatus Izimaplasma sp.]|nr:hypothetical protein [Candidatus Izimaplasma bacterium]